MPISPKTRWLLLSTSLVGVASLTGPVSAQIAEDQIQGNVSIFGGGYQDIEYKYLTGALLLPTEGALSLQFDGMVGQIDGDSAMGLGAQMFWEIGADYDFGILADAFKTDAGGGIEQQHLAISGGYYSDAFSLYALIGQQYELNEGTFGMLSASYVPTDDLSISLTHSFQPDSDGTTTIGIDKRFLAGNSSMSLFANAGYVHDTDSWDTSAGVRIYFGDTRRAEVSRGSNRFRGAGGGVRGLSTTQMFLSMASKQVKKYNDEQDMVE
ncbi:MAG: hypothetical protein GYB53_23435 [Rhodobacteraceae bacterium]|nr:hypothetical protein [Paracoccaceae bacterium]MBR9819638.1 hypothetical protein [Paracoccaceae bacterium]